MVHRPVLPAKRPAVVSYRGAQLRDSNGAFVERDADSAELSVDHGYYHAADDVALHGSGFEHNAAITITISDPEEHFASRTLTAQSDELGAFDTTVVADPSGNLETHIVEATDGVGSSATSYQVIRDDDPTVDPPSGDVLRTYRLALITDPGYAAYSGGPSFVTAAKVALMNRVDQVYRDDLSIHPRSSSRTTICSTSTRGTRPPRRTVPAVPRPASRSPRSPAAPARRVRASSSDRSSARATTTSATSPSASRAAASPTSASSAARTRPAAARASRRRSATSMPSTTSRTRWATSSAATTRSTETS